MAVEVNGVEISEDEVKAEVERLQPDYERYVTANGGEPDLNQLKEWALENLIEKELLIQEARRAQEAPSEDKIKAYLQENSAAFEERRSDKEKRALCIQDFKVRALVKSVRKNARPPTAERVRQEYENKSANFTVPESLKVSHVCRVPQPGFDKPQAYIDLLALRKNIKNSTLDWAEAVRESDTYRDDFGMFDTVTRGMLRPEIEEKLFALNDGDISDVIELETGSIHLFKILEKREPELLPFERVREDIAAMLFNEAAENALNNLLDNLKKGADITR